MEQSDLSSNAKNPLRWKSIEADRIVEDNVPQYFPRKVLEYVVITTQLQWKSLSNIGSRYSRRRNRRSKA